MDIWSYSFYWPRFQTDAEFQVRLNYCTCLFHDIQTLIDPTLLNKLIFSFYLSIYMSIYTSKTRYKGTTVERFTNYNVLAMFSIEIALSLLCAICSTVWLKDHSDVDWYLQLNQVCLLYLCIFLSITYLPSIYLSSVCFSFCCSLTHPIYLPHSLLYNRMRNCLLSSRLSLS